MSDTPITLEDAGESAFSSLTTSASDTPTESVEATTPTDEAPAEAPEAPTEEVVDTVEEEAPLDEFDPEKLPQELKPLYKNLMKGFTQGRQKDREEVNALKKELESLRRPSEPEQQEDIDPITAIERIAEQKVLEAKVKDFRTQAILDYESADDRLKKSTEESQNEKYDEIMDTWVGSQLDAILEKHIEENGSELGFDYKKHQKSLIADWDQYVQKNIERYLSKQKALTKQNTSRIEKANPKTSRAEVVQNDSMNIEDAMDAAWKKLSQK